MRKFFQEFKFEFDSMFNIHRQSIALLFAIPMLYTLLFAGLFYRNSVTNVPIIICNLDAGTHGRSISRDLFDTPEISVVAMESNPFEIENQMEKFGASGAIVIPRDFSKKINELQPTSVELILNNSNTVLGGTVLRAVQSVVAAHNAIVTVNQRAAYGWDLYQSQSAMISMSSRVLYNPTGGYIDFFLATLIIHAGQIATVFVLAPSIVIEKRFRGSEILDRLTAYLTSKLILYSTFELVTISICLGAAIGGFGMICRGNFFRDSRADSIIHHSHGFLRLDVCSERVCIVDRKFISRRNHSKYSSCSLRFVRFSVESRIDSRCGGCRSI